MFVRAAARGMQVLAAFHHSSGALTLSEVAQRAGLDRSAAQRLIHTLSKLGYIRRAPDGRGYLPGLRLLDHTLDVLRLDPVVQRATPVLLELRRSVRERVDLSLFDETRLIYAFRLQSKRETFYATMVGHSIPLYCTAGGRAALSALPEAEAAALLERLPLERYTAQTETDPARILARVAEARRDGFAAVQEEFVLGEVAIGAPITDQAGRLLGAIHVAGTLSEWTLEDFVAQAAPLAVEAARAVRSGL
ncbi:IclR family transcriptional regulator [Roseivivax sp. CAU 1761]